MMLPDEIATTRTRLLVQRGQKSDSLGVAVLVAPFLQDLR
jgi:hypothetical protein